MHRETVFSRALLGVLALVATLTQTSCLSTEFGKRDLTIEFRTDGNSDRIDDVRIAVGTADQFEEAGDDVDALRSLFTAGPRAELEYAQEFWVPPLVESPKRSLESLGGANSSPWIRERYYDNRKRERSCLILKIRKDWVATHLDPGPTVLLLAKISGTWKVHFVTTDDFILDRSVRIDISDDVRRNS